MMTSQTNQSLQLCPNYQTLLLYVSSKNVFAIMLFYNKADLAWREGEDAASVLVGFSAFTRKQGALLALFAPHPSQGGLQVRTVLPQLHFQPQIQEG